MVWAMWSNPTRPASAPGGSDEAGGVNLLLSTVNNGATTPGLNGFGYRQGTSFAAPQAVGVASLMLAVNDAPVSGSGAGNVSEEGLANGLMDSTGTGDTTDLTKVSGVIAISDVDSGSVTVSLTAAASDGIDGFVNIDPMSFDDPATGKRLLYWGSGFGPIKVRELAPDRISFAPGSAAMPLVEASLAIAVGLVGAMVTVGRVIETAAAPPPAPSAIRTAAAAASGALP